MCISLPRIVGNIQVAIITVKNSLPAIQAFMQLVLFYLYHYCTVWKVLCKLADRHKEKWQQKQIKINNSLRCYHKRGDINQYSTDSCALGELSVQLKRFICQSVCLVKIPTGYRVYGDPAFILTTETCCTNSQLTCVMHFKFRIVKKIDISGQKKYCFFQWLWKQC